MDVEQAECFVAAAQEDYTRRIAGYMRAVAEEDKRAYWVREMRADVLAAQQVREVALTELDLARREQEERESTEEQRVQREQAHNGWCERCGTPDMVMLCGDVDLCRLCREREVGAAAGEGSDRGR